MSDAPAASGCPHPHAGGDPSGRCPAGGDLWEESAGEYAEQASRRAAAASHLDEDRAVDMSRAVAEARAGRAGAERITEGFLRTLGRKLGHGHPLSERTGAQTFTWTPEAERRLAEVPEFCRELTRWRVEWTALQKGLGTTITPEVMEVKYEMWGRVSHAIRERRDEGLPWTDEAYARFERIPDFVKGQVLEAVEGNARTMGARVVDSTTVDRVIARWVDTGDFHEGLYGFR